MEWNSHTLPSFLCALNEVTVIEFFNNNSNININFLAITTLGIKSELGRLEGQSLLSSP